MKLIFTSRKTLLARLIRFFTSSKVSHVLIGDLHFYGQPVVMHSTHGGLRIDTFEVWQQRTDSTVYEVWEIIPDVSSAIPVLAAKLGSGYDLPNLFGNALSILMRKLGVKLRNLFADPERFVCSELVVHLDPSGLKIPEFKKLDPEKTSAEDLLQICRKSGRFRRADESK